MAPSRASIACLAVLVLTVGCGLIADGSTPVADGTGLVFEVSPAQVRPGQAFTVTFPPDTGVAADLVLRRGDEPLYVFHGHSGPAGPMGPEKVQDGTVITHPALEVGPPGQPQVREAEFPTDVEPGTVRICSEADCAEFEVIAT